MSITAAEFESGIAAWRDERAKKAASAGPQYTGDRATNPTIWYDQIFERAIDPVGTVNCRQALRVGSTANALDIALVASTQNKDAVKFPAGATVTVSFTQSDKEDGVYEDVGPTICVKAPAAGIEADPDCEVARFAAGNFTKPWLMVTLEFSGAITGGTVDCALAYMPR